MDTVIKERDVENRRRTGDFIVLPLLSFGFMIYQLDRMNIASALTGGFAEAASIDQNTVNLGNQLMFIGVVALEIPSNIVLQITGPRKWIGAQVFAFGMIASMQVFVWNKTGFLITRSLLGLAEAGYIPGSMYTLSTWYTSTELTKRIAIFFFGMFGGAAVSPLLGAALLRAEGAGGLTGWQWIFLVEGIITIIMSLVLFCFLPEIPGLLNRPPIAEEADETASGALEKSDIHADAQRISAEVVWKTLTNYRKWSHFVGTACVFSTWSPLLTYTPSILMSLGFNRIAANALTAVGTSLTLPVIFFFAWLSDKTGARGLIVMAAIACYLIALIVLRTLHPHVSGWSRFGLWTVVNALAVGYHPIHNAWIQINCPHPGERSISITMCKTAFETALLYSIPQLTDLVVMSATSGLMAGTQIFRQDEAARYYPRGLSIMIGLVSAGLVMMGVQECIYRRLGSRCPALE